MAGIASASSCTAGGSACFALSRKAADLRWRCFASVLACICVTTSVALCTSVVQCASDPAITTLLDRSSMAATTNKSRCHDANLAKKSSQPARHGRESTRALLPLPAAHGPRHLSSSVTDQTQCFCQVSDDSMGDRREESGRECPINLDYPRFLDRVALCGRRIRTWHAHARHVSCSCSAELIATTLTM